MNATIYDLTPAFAEFVADGICLEQAHGGLKVGEIVFRAVCVKLGRYVEVVYGLPKATG